MAEPKPLPPGKSVRFWTRLEDLPPIFLGPIPPEIGLCWFSYNKDGSLYTGASFSADEIESPTGVLAGKDTQSQKISIHGSGKILGPDRHETKALRPDDHLGFSIRGITGRAEVCRHLIAGGGNYVVAFETKEHIRATDMFLKDVLEEHGRFVLSIEVAPEGTDTTADLAAWITKPLDDGKPILIIANMAFNAGEDAPDWHHVQVPRGS